MKQLKLFSAFCGMFITLLLCTNNGNASSERGEILCEESKNLICFIEITRDSETGKEEVIKHDGRAIGDIGSSESSDYSDSYNDEYCY